MEPLLDKMSHQKSSIMIAVAAVCAVTVEATLCGLFRAFGELSVLGDSNDIGILIYYLHVPGLFLLSYLPFDIAGSQFFVLLISFTTAQWFLLAWGLFTLLKKRVSKHTV
jgi:hypothetical protein